METKEINEENIKTLVKLGIDTKDIADIYLSITKKGEDISKSTYINNLTNILKYFQTRNNEIKDEEDKAIFKDDVVSMIKRNKKLVGMDIDKKIKPMCKKIDSYYFMNAGYTNKLIKNNPKIFNINKVDLEVYSTLLSDFAIKIENKTVNLFEYIIKQNSEFLNNDVQKVYGRIMYMKENKKSKLFSNEEISLISQNTFCINDEELEEKYKIPKYSGENITDYKQKILKEIN